MVKNKWLSLRTALLFLGAGHLAASEPPQNVEVVKLDNIQEKLDKINSLIAQAIETLHIPGCAIGIVVDDQIVFTKGYGVRHHFDPSPVSENTLFAIGSCSKAFTTFALGQLVDEGILNWDDPVIKHLPEFRLHDVHATHHLTLRDLVTHRSGLPRHDLVWFNSKFPRYEFLTRLQHLEPTCDLREKFQYNNLMYAVAGLVIERVSGRSWEAFVGDRIFKPLGMTRSNFTIEQSQKSDDFAFPHTEKNEQIKVIPFRDLSNIGPAGSINSSAENMARWIQLQLSQGDFQGEHLINTETLRDMHIVHMAIPSQAIERTYGLGYGLGWLIGLHKGHYVIEHGGAIDGFMSNVLLLPEEKIGVVVLTNSDSHFLFPKTAALEIASVLIGKSTGDELSGLAGKEKQLKAAMEKTDDGKDALAESTIFRSSKQYIGEFHNPGYGDVEIFLDGDELTASYNDIIYSLKHKCYDHFIGSTKLREASQFGCYFTCNSSGDISEFHLAIEPSLAPIVFKKKSSSELLAFDYLKKFIGTFEGSVFSIAIAFKGGRLTATVPGQPSCEMKPEKLNLFSLKEVPNCSLQFVTGSDETVSELHLHQAGQTFTLKAK
ncbi:MAG: serine hydrolase [Chlamydiae bacterium]|nr:serine hydrolase [Chlamydiota bacterium]